MLEIKTHPSYGYLVANDGRIFIPATRFSKAHWTHGSLTKSGYMMVRLPLPDGSRNLLVHRIVAETFLEPDESRPFVDHINRNRADNRVENLRWVTRSENQRNSERVDNVSEKYGVHSYEDTVEYNKKNCSNWYHRNKEKIKEQRSTTEFREKENARRREKYASNPDFYREKQRLYRHKNTEVFNNG